MEIEALLESLAIAALLRRSFSFVSFHVLFFLKHVAAFIPVMIALSFRGLMTCIPARVGVTDVTLN